jgi:prephenate dehydrogenase
VVFSIFHPPSSLHYLPGVRWNKIALVGVGLLGGSLGLAVKHRRLARQVAGYVRREPSIKDCLEAGAVDFATTDLLAVVWDADLVILCTPLGQMRPLVQRLLPALKRGAIVTDVGSVKSSVVKDVETMIARAGAYFVGSHPLAGGEKQGVLAARADLFKCAVCVVTPTKGTNASALRQVEKLWKDVGARCLRTTPDAHDALVSRSSHLPHLMAVTLTNLVLDPKLPPEQSLLCATGFRDTTRIASGSPEMWRDIALTNRKHIQQAVGSLVSALRKFQSALKRGDAKTIARFFETAKHRRDKWCVRCGSPAPE